MKYDLQTLQNANIDNYVKSCDNSYSIAIYSCTNGVEPDECDDKVEDDAQMPTSCGMITDNDGSTRTHKISGEFGCFAIENLVYYPPCFKKQCTIEPNDEISYFSLESDSLFILKER